MADVIVVIGAGQIGQAIARRVGVGKHVLLADMRQDNASAAADTLGNAGYEVSVATVDASSREAVHALVKAATERGNVTGLIHAAGVSPTQASPPTILKVDLYGTALVLEEFGNVIARGGAGVVIASQSGHRLPPLTVEQNKALATTPVEQLLGLPFLQPDQVKDPLHAYQLSKRGNSLRVMAEAVRWGKRGARVNTISPGIIVTPLAKASKACWGLMKWMCASMPPAVAMRPSPATTSVAGPTTITGVTPAMTSGLPAFPIPTMSPPFTPRSAL